MANLLEAYANRLTYADKIYAKNHQGERLTESKKILIAKCLENTQRFMNEAIDQSHNGGATQGGANGNMGLFTKFSLNLVNCAIPSLIAPDIVMTHPMSSMSGYVSYVKFCAGVDKGDIAEGDVFNDAFRLGKVDEKYTSARVVETAAGTELELAWTPAVKKTFKTITVAGKEVEFDDRKQYSNEELATVAYKDVKIMKAAGGDAVYANITGDKVTGLAEGDRVAYVYDNVIIPQKNLPLLVAKMDAIPLIAKARRIAIYYSQMAAFQAKTDYGMDLGAQLSEKAIGQLAYEIDTEVVKLLADNAAEDAELTWSKTLPVGVSKAEHYEGFAEMVAMAGAKIYNKTQRYQPNYMLISSSILPVLGFIKGFTAANVSKVNGPYFAGTLNGVKVYVSPALAEGEYVLGVNDGDLNCSAAVYAPYMPIVPTQLLGHADGSMSQGFSTLYDLKILNPDLLVKGKVVA